MPSVPFCIIEKPFMIWSADVQADNEYFLQRLDANLYDRMAHYIIGTFPDEETGQCSEQKIDDQGRKDVSTLSRLLWHHGMETLIMLLGAYIQAPSAVHAYFLRAKTEDAEKMAKYIFENRCPKYNRLKGAPFSLHNLLNGIHYNAGWGEDRSLVITNVAKALRKMLGHYVDRRHRAEYNSIKHGLRASHGYFGLAVGLEEIPGVEPPPEAMEMIGSSRDASFFDVVKPLDNIKDISLKINFKTEKVSVSWSLEKVLMDLQIISLMIHNTTSALRIINGSKSKEITFQKILDDGQFWDFYHKTEARGVINSSFSNLIDAREVILATESDVFDSYNDRTIDQ